MILLQNVARQPLKLITPRHAIELLLADKAVGVTERVGAKLRTVNKTYVVPAIIALKQYVKPPKVRWSRQNVLLRDDYTCQYCGGKLTLRTGTIDHVVPRVKGGRSEWHNTVAACFKCNNRKGQKSLSESGLILLHEPRVPQLYDLIKFD